MHKQNSKRSDLTRKFNLRTPVCKKKQIERSNETQTAKETSSGLLIGLKSNFTVAKTLFKLIKWKEGVETKIWDFESPDFDSRAKRKTKNKIRAEIAIENNREKTLEKKNKTNRLMDERLLSAAN